jgi:hypothetical protein
MSLVPEVLLLAVVVVVQFVLIWTLYRRLQRLRQRHVAERDGAESRYSAHD